MMIVLKEIAAIMTDNKSKYILAVCRLIIAFVFAALLPGCDFIKERVEGGLKKELTKVIGPADSYDISIESKSTFALLDGAAKKVVVTGTNIVLAGVPRIAHMEFSVKDLEYDKDKKLIQSIGETAFCLKLTDGDLNRWPQLSKGKLHNVIVSFRKNELVISGRYNITGFWQIPVVTRGILKPIDSKVYFVPAKLQFYSLTIPKSITTAVLNSINPVIDLTTLPVPVKLEDIKTDQGTITISGMLPASVSNLNKLITNKLLHSY